MPFTEVRGIQVQYRIIGDAGPWIALTPGGRRGHDEFVSLAGKLAAKGYRVVLYDRRNTGASEVFIAGEDGEEEIWTDDLYALLSQLGALPAFIGGSSSGARTSILFYLRHLEVVRGLLLFRVTGGQVAAGRLGNNYYGRFILAAQEGGMAAVCETDRFAAIIKANPENRARLMALTPANFIAVMSRWRSHLEAGLHLPITGVSEAELKSIAVPTIIIPGNDQIHDGTCGRLAHTLIPGSELHELPIEDSGLPYVAFEEWEPQEDEIATVFSDFIQRAISGGA